MRLPPLNALRAFEAAARHNGYIAAADELCVTRGAISRHVKLLEEHLGVKLFRRNHKGVELTAVGRDLLPVLTEAFAAMADKCNRISGVAAELRIICPPAMSIRWLFPRLEQFRTAHPEIRVRLTTDFYGKGGFETSEYDLGFSVENVPGRSPDIMVLPLFPSILSPACAPSLLEGAKPLSKPEDLQNFTLLHESPRQEDWTSWVRAFGVEGIDPKSGEIFPNLDMATKAAVMGSGLIMADLALCREEIERGALVMPLAHMKCEEPYGNYALIGSRDSWDDPKIRVFREWLEHVVGEEDWSFLTVSG